MEETIVSSIFSQSSLNIRSISLPQKWGIYMDVWHQRNKGTYGKLKMILSASFFFYGM